MSEVKANQEPSMEEILASIRRIISEEEGGPAKAEPTASTAAQEDDLVLTKVVKPGISGVKTPEPEQAPTPAPNDAELELTETKSMAENTEVEPMPTPTPALDRDQDALVSPEVAAASAAAMSRLVSSRAHAAVELATPGQGLMVETLVRQAVEPVLRDWLDNNLQAIVERLVRREIERISRRAELG